MHSTIRQGVRLVCLIAFIAFIAVRANAQGLTGTIEGKIHDQSGGVMAGVTVTLASPQLIGGPKIVVSTQEGGFHFTVLPPGEYDVTFEGQGFQKVERKGIALLPDQTVTLDQQMSPATVNQTVTVTGAAPVVDVRNTEIATTVGTEVSQDTPVSRRFTDLVDLLPGVQNGLYTFSPANAVNGSGVTDNVYTVEGINIVDPDVSSVVTDVVYDDIQEAQVSTSGQAAEFGTASGGAFNYILKSGSNEFHGLADGYFQPHAFTANNISAAQAAQHLTPTAFNHIYEGGGDLGGPILKDRLWFFTSYSRLSETEVISSFPVAIPTTNWSVTEKTDLRVNNKNKVNFFYNYRYRYSSPFNFGVTTADDPESWISITWHNTVGGLNWTYTPSSNTVVQFRAGAALFNLINGEPNVVAGTPVYVEESSGLQYGGPTQTAGLAKRNRYEINGDVMHLFNRFLGGSHQLKVGASFNDEYLNTQGRDQGAYDGTRLQLLDGQPYRVQELDVDGHLVVGVHNQSFYVEDQYAVGRVTINGGVRYDHWSGSTGPDILTGGYWFSQQTVPRVPVASLSNVAPRIGVAFDPTGKRNWAIHVSYGRYYDRLDGVSIAFATAAASGSVTYNWTNTCAPGVGFNPATFPTEPACVNPGFPPAFAPGELGSVVNDTRPVNAGTIDPNLKMPYTDSYNAGVQHNLGHNFSLTVSALFKAGRDYWSEVNNADPFPTAYNAVTVTNPLTSQPMVIYSLKKAYLSLAPQLELTNPTYLGRLYDDYEGLEVVIRRPMTHHFMAQISYDLGRSYGNIGTLFFDHQSSPYLNPNSLINADGDQELDRRHIGQFIGAYQLPWGLQLSGHFQLLSGMPLTTTLSGGAGVDGATYARFTAAQYPLITSAAFLDVPVEPQGTLRTGWQNTLDLRIAERFKVLREGKYLTVTADVFNIFNENTPTAVDSLKLAVPTQYLVPASIMTPRAGRIGVKFEF